MARSMMATKRWMKWAAAYPLALMWVAGWVSGATAAEPGGDDAEAVWERTVEAADQAWRDTLDWFRDDEGTPGEAGDQGFSAIWEGLLPRLEETLERDERQAALPDQTWVGEDKASNRAAVDDLLDEAAAILADSAGERFRQRIRAHEAEIRALREAIDALRRKRVSAPRDSVWRKTVEEYDAGIAQREQHIETLRGEIADLKREFATRLRDQGVAIDDEQLDALLSTVVGDDLMRMAAAFENTERMTLQLEQLMLDSQEDAPTARRYYGMYTVLLKVLVRMHEQLLSAIAHRYLPEINAIAARTGALRDRTRHLLGQASGRDPAARRTLLANLEAQDLTLRAAGEYGRYLMAQQRSIRIAQRRLEQDLAIAVNTYETVKVSGELVALMRAGQRSLDTLGRLRVPVLRGFQNLEMKREFERLTERLRDPAP